MIKHKDYILKNYNKYGIMASDDFLFDPSLCHPITQKEMLGLLNILEAHDEDLESFHNAAFNGTNFFCEICGPFESDDETYNALMQFNTFYTDEEFIAYMLEHIQDTIKYSDSYEEAMEKLKEEAFDGNNDDLIVKTSDGYVHIVSY